MWALVNIAIKILWIFYQTGFTRGNSNFMNTSLEFCLLVLKRFDDMQIHVPLLILVYRE